MCAWQGVFFSDITLARVPLTGSTRFLSYLLSLSVSLTRAISFPLSLVSAEYCRSVQKTASPVPAANQQAVPKRDILLFHSRTRASAIVHSATTRHRHPDSAP